MGADEVGFWSFVRAAGLVFGLGRGQAAGATSAGVCAVNPIYDISIIILRVLTLL